MSPPPSPALAPDLVRAFVRLRSAPPRADPGCLAPRAPVEALRGSGDDRFQALAPALADAARGAAAGTLEVLAPYARAAAGLRVRIRDAVEAREDPVLSARLATPFGEDALPRRLHGG